MIPLRSFEWDVVIFGAGPAGCATAIALRQQGIDRVLLVEPGRRGPRVGESVPPDIRLLLEALGLWDEFVADRHDPCLGSCSSWGADELGYNDFLLNPLGQGWHLERARFDALLERRARALGAELWSGRASSVVREGAGFLVRVEPVRQEASEAESEAVPIRARLLVDATGHRSRIAGALGGRRLGHDRLTCVYRLFEGPVSFGSLTMLEAVEHGWWYAARLPERRCVIAVASDPELVRALGLHRSEPWQAGLEATRHLARALPDLRAIGEPWTCSAPSSRLERSAGPGWIAVGDAAAAYDPISSAGIFKALDDGLRAGRAIGQWLAGHGDALEHEADRVAARFAGYLEQRRYFYELERRWPDAPFWLLRRTRASPSSDVAA